MVSLLNYSLIHIAREPLSLFGVKQWFFSIYGTTVKLQSDSQQRQSVLIIWRGERPPTRFYLSFNLDGWKMRNHSQRKVVLVGLRANRDSKKLKGSNFGKNLVIISNVENWPEKWNFPRNFRNLLSEIRNFSEIRKWKFWGTRKILSCNPRYISEVPSSEKSNASNSFVF